MAHARALKTVYGPVPSRRLGQSLGVSPVPHKVCTYSCVYCQLGRTTRRTTRRRSFFPKEEILAEIAAALPDSAADYITFAGDGEPTLCEDLGWLIRKCKAEFDTPVAVITNGSLLDRPEVRADLLEADVVMPSLDAGSAAVFKRINRPHRDLSFESIVEGLVAFRKEYRGLMRLEVMLVSGLNDSAEPLNELRRALDRVQPDRVYLMVPTRPPAEAWVKAPSPADVRAAQRILEQGREITGHERGEFGITQATDPERAIMDICRRHPLREKQAKQIERSMGASNAVAALVARGDVSRVAYHGATYLVPSRRHAGAPARPEPKERQA
jgi:wyosine [tRNA(Phe)-imidazoG37] synthetase (radical SAM superfamily)